jgi:polyhydroxybutyrate depolymerase
MYFWRYLLLFCLVLSIIVYTHETKAKTEQETFEGRPFTLTTPDATFSRSTVVLLHGARGSGERLRKSSEFDLWAKRYELAVVYPTGLDGWNDGRVPTKFISTTADDVGYLKRLLVHLHSNGLIPEVAAYFMGFSNGGGMAMRMACEQSNLVKGISIVATKEFLKTSCRGFIPVPIVFFLGTADRLAPHKGNAERQKNLFGRAQSGRYSAKQTIERWGKRNGCSGPALSNKLDADPTDGTLVLHQSFQGCVAPFEYYEIKNGGHTWPGTKPAKKRAARQIFGKTSQEINANEVTMRLWFDPKH